MKELYNRYREIINYLVVGVLTTVVSLAVYYGLVLTILDPRNPLQLQAANVLSWICAVTFAYFTNRIFVFESKNDHMVKEAGAFFAARIGTLVMAMRFCPAWMMVSSVYVYAFTTFMRSAASRE